MTLAPPELQVAIDPEAIRAIYERNREAFKTDPSGPRVQRVVLLRWDIKSAELVLTRHEHPDPKIGVSFYGSVFLTTDALKAKDSD